MIFCRDDDNWTLAKFGIRMLPPLESTIPGISLNFSFTILISIVTTFLCTSKDCYKIPKR